MMTPVILNGSKPLWDNLDDYVRWIIQHEDEIYDAYGAGDEDAELIVEIIAVINRQDNAKMRAVLKIATERYISQHYPEIAQIAGKEST